MSFLQIISFHTDRIERFAELEESWTEATEGRRTLVDSALYRDRTDGSHYVAVNYFPSWEAAQVNSNLPETDAFAREAVTLTTGSLEFTDLDLVSSADVRATVAAGLRTMLETSEAPAGLLHDEVTLDMYVPNCHRVERGPDRMAAVLREEAPGRTIEQWEVHPSGDGVIVEYSYRTHPTAEQPETLSVGVIVARLRGGRVGSLKVHCAGNWTAGIEQQISESHLAGASS
jgi:hypothetical protein